MRAYFFTNFYLSSIQHGIQSAHCLHEMFTKYDVMQYDLMRPLKEWADNHKTIIVKNGGDTEGLINVKNIISKMDLPFAFFEEPGISNALTCVGVIVPEKYYNREIYNRFCMQWKRTEAEDKFIKLLETTQLAR